MHGQQAVIALPTLRWYCMQRDSPMLLRHSGRDLAAAGLRTGLPTIRRNTAQAAGRKTEMLYESCGLPGGHSCSASIIYAI